MAKAAQAAAGEAEAAAAQATVDAAAAAVSVTTAAPAVATAAREEVEEQFARSFSVYWEFGAPGHGKGVWDGIGAWMKRTVRQDIVDHRPPSLPTIKTASGSILTPEQVYEHLKASFDTAEYVDSHKLKTINQARPHFKLQRTGPLLSLALLTPLFRWSRYLLPGRCHLHRCQGCQTAVSRV